MAHAQKPDFVFRRNGQVHLNRQEVSVQWTTGSRGVRISGSNAGYIMFWGSVKSTGYPFHSPASASLPLPCITMCHHISTELYQHWCEVNNQITGQEYQEPCETWMRRSQQCCITGKQSGMFGCADRYVVTKVLRIMVQLFKTSVYYMKACHTNMTEQTNIAS
jgi:hypothetical protein